jgi:formylglycine-generating enzyme required for sulfatase activity
MKSVRYLKCLVIFLATVLTVSLAGSSISQSLELNIQLIPGIWITGRTGAVSIEYTTNLDQASGWTLLSKVQTTNSPYFYIDSTATNSMKRFYRASIENSENTNKPPVNPDPVNLVWINAGSFTMGSPSTEQDRNSNEGPQTQVTISRGYFMDKYETTQEEYQALMGINPSLHKSPHYPVEGVTWFDATNYCGKLTARERAAGRLPEGYSYRLPTEAEWEYACRAGTTTRFSYGDDLNYAQLADYANFSNGGSLYLGPVGMLRPNAWGLYDMYGNVCEWCLDWYGFYPGGSVTDPQGTSYGLYRVHRGGGYDYNGKSCRSAFRYYAEPNDYSWNKGFRPVLAHYK